MADKDRDRTREPNAAVPDPETGTADAQDFGKSDRYANKDQGKDFNFRTTGDGTAWDAGREASITDGTRGEHGMRAADAETPGVVTKDSDAADDEDRRSD